MEILDSIIVVQPAADWKAQQRAAEREERDKAIRKKCQKECWGTKYCEDCSLKEKCRIDRKVDK